MTAEDQHRSPARERRHGDSATQERAALATLLTHRGQWPDVARAVLDRGSAIEVLSAGAGSAQAELPFDLTPIEAELTKWMLEFEQWDADGVRVLSVLDTCYPAQLRDILQVPPILFARGTVVPDRRAVAVVGTRKPSEAGLRLADRVATVLAAGNVTVVSGLAAGIDAAAHRAALRAGGRTVAVIGTGINRFYPAENRALQEEISATGLVLSQFWPDAGPTRASFPMRNAVMSGYSAATVVIEAAERSGARIQARLALEHGRPVVMPRQLLSNEWARRYSERPGVSVVGSDEELIDVVEGVIATFSPDEDLREDMPPLVRP